MKKLLSKTKLSSPLDSNKGIGPLTATCYCHTSALQKQTVKETPRSVFPQDWWCWTCSLRSLCRGQLLMTGCRSRGIAPLLSYWKTSSGLWASEAQRASKHSLEWIHTTLAASNRPALTPGSNYLLPSLLSSPASSSRIPMGLLSSDPHVTHWHGGRAQPPARARQLLESLSKHHTDHTNSYKLIFCLDDVK